MLAVALVGPPAAAAVTPKTALIFGDSLTHESRFQIDARMQLRAGWVEHTHAFPQTAPCDWNGWLAADLATYNPSVVGILTAGNTGQTSCMNDLTGAPIPTGSVAYYAKYRSDLETFFATVTASGAKLVFFSSPPFTDTTRNTAAKEITKIATELAFRYHGVSISGAVRSVLSNSGAYAPTKPCIAIETPAMGCDSLGRIAIRTVPGYVDAGLHLCPIGLVPGTNSVCAVYSSGEFRFGRAMVNGLVAPPPPKLV